MTSLIAEEDPFLVPLASEDHELQIRSTIQDMVLFVNDLVVDSETAYKKVTSLYRQARDWKKTIEAKRKEMVDPFRQRVAEINDKAKELTDPLDRVIEKSNSKVQGYQLMLAEKKRIEDEKLRETAAIFDAQEEIYIPPMEKIIRGDGAIAVTKTEKKFRLVDIAKVPLKYLTIDEKLIAQDIKLGLTEISGLEIWDEQTTQLRVR